MTKLNQHLSIDSQSVWVEKSDIKEFADLPRRYKLAELSNQISRLSLGIANTRIKKLGNVQIQPKELLLDGLHKELNVGFDSELLLIFNLHYFLKHPKLDEKFNYSSQHSDFEFL